MPDTDSIEFTKGHGTQNDFVVLPDPQVRLELTVEQIAALCDRQRGLGADGVLRVARAGALRAAGVLAELPDGVGEQDWFMDYRNADGSIAEMCGNGVRVFAHYLAASGLETRAEFVVGSRAGARPRAGAPRGAGRRCVDHPQGRGAPPVSGARGAAPAPAPAPARLPTTISARVSSPDAAR